MPWFTIFGIWFTYLEFNNFVNIDSTLVYFREISDKKINFLKDILDENGNIKTWKSILQQSKISKQFFFKWLQFLHTMPNLGKKMVNDNGNCQSVF